MKNCSPRVGRRFLAGEMSSDEESQFVSHLDNCRQCQADLENSAGSRDDWWEARNQLKLMPSSLLEELQVAKTNAVEHELGFLSPTDHPDMLGRIGIYEVSGVIGRGGMGIVLKALDPSLNRFVAIKVLDPRLASVGVARQRFAREARAMAAISHEHVVPVFAVEEQAGLPYLVMEYITGMSLETRLQRDGPMDVLSIIRVGLQVAQALSAAHSQGLVHRDIKPANILLDKDVERIRVGDFGLAQVAHEANCTQSGAVAGTPQFMSPEQVRGEACSPSADLFGLGAMLYATCTGSSPFVSDTVFGVMQRVLQDKPRSVREVNANIPIWLEKLIFRLLEKEPNHRFASSKLVAELLERELAYLQNPSTVKMPDRGWLRQRPNSNDGAVRFVKALCGITAICLLLVAAWRSWPKKEVEPSGRDTTEDLSQPAAALWNADGTTDLVDRVEQFKIHTQRSPPTRDPWNQRLDEIGQRLTTINDSNSW